MSKRVRKKDTSKKSVAIIMGSDSDYKVMKDAAVALKKFGITYEVKIVSAHRTPKEMYEFAKTAASKYKVIIAGAGGAAHLPGMVASLTEIPVIGVPVAATLLKGQDSLLSIVQMPKGAPVATMAINGAFNAGIMAAKIISISTPAVQKKIKTYKNSLRLRVLKKKIPKK